MAGAKITIKDVAKEAGVSVATVSRALNDAGRIDAQTKERIKRVIERLGYRPNSAAQSLKTQRTRNILLVVPDIVNPFYANLARALQLLVKQKNYNLTLFNTNEALDEELSAIETAKEICAGGIVFASVSSYPCVLDALKSASIPAVLLNSYGACEFDTVHGEVNVGTRVSTEYLIKNGHTRIAFAGAPEDGTIGCSRKRGYIQALEKAGLHIDSRLIFEMGFSEEAGYQAGKYFSALQPRPSAICCANDIIAMGVLAALHEDGVRVPEDISVTGMDNIIYARISRPPLTSVTNDPQQFAVNAFTMLFDRIEQTYTGKPREVILPRTLVVRESAAPLK